MTHVMWFLVAGGMAILCSLAGTHVSAAPPATGPGAAYAAPSNGTAFSGSMPPGDDHQNGMTGAGPQSGAMGPGGVQDSGLRNGTAPGNKPGITSRSGSTFPNGTPPAIPNGTVPRGNAAGGFARNGTHMAPPDGTFQNGTRPAGAPPDGTAVNTTHQMVSNGTPPAGTGPGSRGNWSVPNGTPPAPPDRTARNATGEGGAMPDIGWLISLFSRMFGMDANVTPSGNQSPGGLPPGMMNRMPSVMPNGTPPSGTRPDGTGLGGNPGSSPYNLSGVYTLDSGSATLTGQAFTSDIDDVSAVYVTGGGHLTLVNPAVTTSGDTSSNDASSFYGLNAAVLAASGSTVTISGGTISSGGSGANGAFATGSGTTVSLSGTTITATGGGGHGVMATLGGTLDLTDVDISTAGANSAPLATDRGSGTITVNGGTITSSGDDSPGIYSTGAISVTGAEITATGSEAAVIEGSNAIDLTGTTLSGAAGSRDRGIMVYQSMSGDAESGLGTFTMTGGSYTWPSTTGPAFSVTNTNGKIVLTGVTVASSSGVLLKAAAGDWGTAGSNGGTATFVASEETLTGDLVTDSISSIDASLADGTTLSGAIDAAALTLDATSTWNVTGDSVLTSLTDPDGLSGATFANIVGNGYTVTYDPDLEENIWLAGGTYALANGGILAPA